MTAHPPSTQTAQRRAEIGVRRAKAVDLAASGATYREIAASLKVSTTTAYEDVTRGLAAYGGQVAKQRREALLARELRTLEMVQRGSMGAALSGDAAAALTVLRCIDRRAKLLGLNAPVEVQISDTIDAEIKALAAQLAEDGMWGQVNVPMRTAATAVAIVIGVWAPVILVWVLILGLFLWVFAPPRRP